MVDAAERVAEAQNILDTMTKGLMENKAAKNAKLTPVGMERPTALGEPRPAILSDADIFGIETYLGTIEQAIGNIRAALNAPRHVDAPLGGLTLTPEEREQTTAPPADPNALEDEDPPFEDIGDRIDRLTEEAKASVFSGSIVPGWVCPVHGSFEERKGKTRTFRACTACTQFERADGRN